eukprot:jgi/Psemu1/35412/gm1.35412_g
MPSTGGRKAGVGNCTKAELESMFAAIGRAILPCGVDDWNDAPTGNPNMRWDISEANEVFQMIGNKSRITDGEDRYDVERNEFTPPPPPSVTTQPVPLLVLGQPTQPKQPKEVTQFEELCTISSSSKKRHYNRKADNKSKMMNAIADRADDKRKVLLQALLAQLTSGTGPSGGGGGPSASGRTTSPTAPQVTTPQVTTTEGKLTAEGGKLKRKVNSLQHCDYSSSVDSDDSDSSSDGNLLGINK